ncbi:MAG: helix-turn-helix transcriptional regulator, partial [Actinomyces sp.]|nr:helix-turn-helix transcriptional regulator [Actinomyces sp.]
MDTSHGIVTREVTRYMRATGLSQAALANAIGLHQSALSKRIRGALRWSITDLDRL